MSDQDVFNKVLAGYKGSRYSASASFISDVKTPIYISRWLNKQKRGRQINIRAVLNHFVVLFNCFEDYYAYMLLFSVINPTNHARVKAYLMYMNKCPIRVHDYLGNEINIYELEADIETITQLRNV